MRAAALLASLMVLFPSGAVSSEPGGSELLSGVRTEYSQLKTYSASVEIDMELVSNRQAPNRVSYVSDIFFDSKGRFAVMNRYGLMGKSIISDGEDMWIYLPALRRYTTLDPPPSGIEYLAADPSSIDTIGTERFLLFSLLSGQLDPPEEDITKISGELDGVPCEILEFNYGEPLYRVWIDTFSKKILKLELETTPRFRMADEVHEMSFSYSEVHTRVEFDSILPEDVFRFKPAAGDEAADELYLMRQYEEALYIGDELPLFSFTPLGERRELDISDLTGEYPALMVFFWDSQSPSSGRMGRALSEIASESDIPVIGVNPSDGRREAARFIRENGFDFPVALDENREISERYMVDSYPTLFIASGGRINHIYTGFFDGLRSKIYEDIQHLAAPERRRRRDKGFSRKWHADIKSSGITSAGGSLVALTVSDEFYFIGPSGRIRNVKESPEGLRRLVGAGDDGGFAAYRQRGRKVAFFDSDGDISWSYDTSGGLNILGFYRNNFILGQNSSDGTALIDLEGKKVWSSTAVASALHASAGDLDARGETEVAASDGSSSLYIIGSGGELQSSINTEMKLEFSQILGSNSILISGSTRGNQILSLVDSQAMPVWEIILGVEGTARVTVCRQHPLKDWVAVGTLDGQVFVYDLSGDLLAYRRERGMDVQLDWLEVAEGQYMLATSTVEGGVTCYSVVKE